VEHGFHLSERARGRYLGACRLAFAIFTSAQGIIFLAAMV
jgi:hypothetical protein